MARTMHFLLRGNHMTVWSWWMTRRMLEKLVIVLVAPTSPRYLSRNHSWVPGIGDHFWSSLWFSNKQHYLSGVPGTNIYWKPSKGFGKEQQRRRFWLIGENLQTKECARGAQAQENQSISLSASCTSTVWQELDDVGVDASLLWFILHGSEHFM